MKSSPLDHQRQGTGRKIAVKHAERLDAELGFGTAVMCMEMRRLVIEEVHADHDTEESRDLRHAVSLRRSHPESRMRKPGNGRSTPD